jgi:carbon monoxide dehydrogenase subunit G
MIGGTSFQVVDRPVEEAWSAFVDPRSYRRMLPAAEEARVVGRGADGPILRIRHRVGLLSARYHLRLHFAPATRDVAFELSRSHPNDLQAARGFLQARPYGEDRTLIRWGILADPGGGVFGGLVRGQIHSWMLRVPTTIRAFLHHRRSRQPVAAPQATAG